MPAPKVEGKGGLVIVGEAPGVKEVVKGEPFVGPSGEVLRKALKSVGLMDFDSVHITNALLCLPPSGEADSQQTIGACRPRLISELREREPDIILALGNTALHAITNNHKLKITQEQGKLYKTEFGLMIPAVHPAMVLRAPGAYKGFRSALAYTIKLANGHKPKNPGESRFAVVSADKVASAVKSMMDLDAGHVFAVDIETTGFNPRQNEIICLGISWAKNKTLIFQREHLTQLKNFFAQEDKVFVWHNGKFDSEFLKEVGIEARVDEDTMLMHYALNEIKGTHDLEQLAVNELGAEEYEYKLKPYLKGKGKTYADIPDDVLHQYLAKDCDYTRQLYHTLRPKLEKSNDLVQVYTKILIPASHFLQKVERAGIYVDKKNILTLKKELEVRQVELVEAIQKMVRKVWNPIEYVEDVGAKSVPEEFNPGSWQQLQWLLYDKIGFKVPRGYSKNTRAETLENIQPSHKLIDLILELRSVGKQLSTYVNGIHGQIEKDGKVHSTYLIHGTVTGRLSSREPNMQNIPRDKRIKNIFRSTPGTVFIEADYRGAELRMLAYLSKDPFLVKVFREGRDLHTEVAIAMYGEDFTKDQRVRAKALNFGLMYGRGPRDLAREFGISNREAVEMIEKWFARMPVAQKYLEEVRSAAASGRILRSPLGRFRRFGLVSAGSLHHIENEAANFAISSTASDMTLLSAIRMEPLLRELDASVVNLVHDSILVETPDTELSIVKTSKIIVATMMDTPDKLLGAEIPFEVELKKGIHWGALEEFELKALTEDMKTALISR